MCAKHFPVDYAWCDWRADISLKLFPTVSAKYTFTVEWGKGSCPAYKCVCAWCDGIIYLGTRCYFHCLKFQDCFFNFFLSLCGCVIQFVSLLINQLFVFFVCLCYAFFFYFFYFFESFVNFVKKIICPAFLFTAIFPKIPGDHNAHKSNKSRKDGNV